jgi:hypothetical protein
LNLYNLNDYRPGHPLFCTTAKLREKDLNVSGWYRVHTRKKRLPIIFQFLRRVISPGFEFKGDVNCWFTDENQLPVYKRRRAC